MSKATRRLKKSVKLNICNVIKKNLSVFYSIILRPKASGLFMDVCYSRVALQVSVYL